MAQGLLSGVIYTAESQGGCIMGQTAVNNQPIGLQHHHLVNTDSPRLSAKFHSLIRSLNELVTKGVLYSVCTFPYSDEIGYSQGGIAGHHYNIQKEEWSKGTPQLADSSMQSCNV